MVLEDQGSFTLCNSVLEIGRKYLLSDTIRMKGFFIALCLLCLAMGEVATENGILLLNDDNFQQTVKEHEVMFIDFYSTVVSVLTTDS